MFKIAPRTRKKQTGSLFRELLMVFIVAFVSLYGMTLFISMQTEFMEFFAYNQFLSIFVGLSVALVIAGGYFIYNRSKKLVLSVSIDKQNEQLVLEMKPNYSPEIFSITVPFSHLKYSIRNQSAWFLGYNFSTVSFFNGIRMVGTISTAENWEGEEPAIRELLAELKFVAVRRN